MPPSQRFKSLHESQQLFVMPNAWCEGSARLIESLGYASLGTTSAGIAYSQGYRDSSPHMSDEARFAAVARIVQAVSIPVSADLENGLAKSLKGVEASFLRALDIGCAGASIEDVANYDDPERPVFFEQDEAVERVRAACEAVHRRDAQFVVTARTDILLGAEERSLDEVIARLVAFEQVGADCLFAPGIKTIADLQVVQSALSKPLSVLPQPGMTLEQLATLGVRRVSNGSALFRFAYAQIANVLQGLDQPAGLDFSRDALSLKHLDDVMR